MARYTMRTVEHGHIITTGRRTVGSVRQIAMPRGWIARIGAHSATGVTALVAFYDVVALQCGFPNHAALQAHNRQIRAHNTVQRARARSILRSLTGVSRPRPVILPGPVDDEPYSA
jgi:hypothetical protein